jgi:hypothetical protein
LSETGDHVLAVRPVGGGGEAGFPELPLEVEELAAPGEQWIGHLAGLAGGGQRGDGVGPLAGDPRQDDIEVLAGESGLALESVEAQPCEVGAGCDQLELRLLGIDPDFMAADFLGGDAGGDAIRFDRAFGGGAVFGGGGAFGFFERAAFGLLVGIQPVADPFRRRSEDAELGFAGAARVVEGGERFAGLVE